MSLKLKPKAYALLEALRVDGVPPGAEPRPANLVLNEIILEVARLRRVTPLPPANDDTSSASDTTRKAG